MTKVPIPFRYVMLVQLESIVTVAGYIQFNLRQLLDGLQYCSNDLWTLFLYVKGFKYAKKHRYYPLLHHCKLLF